MVSQAELMSKGYHSLVPGLIKFFIFCMGCFHGKPLCEFCYHGPIQWQDCDIYGHKNSTMKHNVIKKARLALFLNKAVGLKMHFIDPQASYYHADKYQKSQVKVC